MQWGAGGSLIPGVHPQLPEKECEFMVLVYTCASLGISGICSVRSNMQWGILVDDLTLLQLQPFREQVGLLRVGFVSFLLIELFPVSY